MAKVYSWSLGQGQYAYIADPNNLENVYIGTELSGNALKKVSEWTQNSTDALYDAHFNTMVQKVAEQGYSAEFESAESYRTISTTCDNLRGPAGRGISGLKIINETNPLITEYAIMYDDGTYDTFNVYHGQNGSPGRDGNPGPKGDTPVATRTVFVYASGKNGEVKRPKGGSWDHITNIVTPPSGWGTSDGLEHPIYQSTRTFASDPLVQDAEWSEPMLITGENGLPGADGISVEFIYFQMPIMPPQEEYPDTSELESRDEPGWVPTGWSASPMGVDEDNKVEFVATRRKEEIENEDGTKISYWGPWSKASVWSHFGTNGQDGDGVQYIYLRNKGEIVDNPTPKDYLTNEIYQEKDTEWLPSNGTYININNSSITIDDNNTWTDNPCGVTEEYQFEWVAQRKYRKGEDGTQKWQAFSNPTLWAKYGESGSNGTSVRTMYCWTNSTSEIPNIPNSENATNPGGEWQLNFPTRYDYNSGENVVWGITGTIYAHNNEFVKKYSLFSQKDEAGNVIPPEDYYNNYIELEYLPTTEQEGVKYVLYNNEYYIWKGGWDGPFLVTGTKGNDGTPMDYNTIVFCYAPKDFPPYQPPVNVSPKSIEEGLVTSTNKNNDILYWYDFPKTDRLDGEIENGLVMRWYQCAGSVYSENQLIYKWGAVVPNSPMDGESIPGKYMEFRFAVTPDDTQPTIHKQFDNGIVVRYPKSYIDNDSNKTAIGWFTTSNADEEGNRLPEMKSGCTMWQIWNWIDGATNEVSGNEPWQGPTRVSGEKGDQGEMGPVGKRGVTGIPGANYNQMYCLGTETSPFGNEEWLPTGTSVDNRKYGLKKKDFKTWFTSPPVSTILKVTEESKLQEIINVTNKGRVIHYHIAKEVEIGGSKFLQDVENKYYLINQSGDDIIDITSKMELDDEGNAFIYIWCIQGSDVWQAGEYAGYVEISGGKPEDATETNTANVSKVPSSKNEFVKYIVDENGKYYQWVEIDGENVQHKQLGIEWSKPFRIQGVSGLRGISGSRGQVVYPMGVYNENEVYITTKDKAPYVYDTSAGMFYVLNMVDQPWVGRLPENYQDITIGTDGNGNPIYKYMYNGQWITTDQKGDTPSNNFANAEKESTTPAWIMFESFEALYTNIGIIENGMIGSAVYNNEFMFSQQGLGRAGEITNYAEASSKPPINSGFLSAYEWDETGKDDKHWKYRGTDIWLSDKDVNPYEIYNNANKTAVYNVLKEALNGGEPQLNITPIHSFRPNVCINFKTGEMWTSAGKVNFDADGSGYLLDGKILWDYVEDKNKNKVPYFQIGEAGSNGISFSGGSMTIGLLDDYKTEMKETISGLTDTMESYFTSANTYTTTQINAISGATNTLINGAKETLEGLIDNKADTYAQSNDPSSSWVATSGDSNYVALHEGDVWYNTNSGTTQIFSQTQGKDYILSAFSNNNTNATKYYWNRTDIPLEVFEYSDGKSSIYINDDANGFSGYTHNDMWVIPSSAKSNLGKWSASTGVTLVCTSIASSGSTKGGATIAIEYNAEDWEKLDKYTDDTFAQQKFNAWSADGWISPAEMRALKDEAAAIAAESGSTATAANNLGISGASSTYDTNNEGYNTYTAYTAYTAAAYKTALYYSDTGNSEYKTSTDAHYQCIEIDTGAADSFNTKRYANIAKYYEYREKLQNAIIKIQAEKTRRDSISGSTGSTENVVTEAKNAIAKGLGYVDYAAMSGLASTGKIITEGGYLNASLIETENLIAASINTKPSQDSTTNNGRITISNNVIDVYRSKSSSPVLKIIGDDIETTTTTSHTLIYTCQDKETNFTATSLILPGINRQFNVHYSTLNLYSDDNLKIDSDILCNINMKNRPSFNIWISGISTTGKINLFKKIGSEISTTLGFPPSNKPSTLPNGSVGTLIDGLIVGGFNITNNKGGKFYAHAPLIDDTNKKDFVAKLFSQQSFYGGDKFLYHREIYSLDSDDIDLFSENFTIGVEFISGYNTISYNIEPKINLLQIGKNGMLLQTTGNEYIDFSSGEGKDGYTIHSNNNAIKINSEGVHLKINGTWFSPVINGSGTASTLTFTYKEDQNE